MQRLFGSEFRMPFVILVCLAAGAIPGWSILWVIAIAIGLGKIIWDSIGKIRNGKYSLDYIAFLAMIVSLPAEQYLAGAIVALMITGGEALDEYAASRAERALRSLAERIPKHCTVRLPNGSTVEKPIQSISKNEIIIVKPNELVPLDGVLRSDEALLNEANLTGEALPVTVVRNTFIKSGSVNIGELIEISVEGSFETSTYMRIVRLVEDAKKHQAHVVRLAEKVNFPFTAIALLLAGGAYLFSDELSRALAVLVIATPCPLIIAAPVAFIGGLSRAARKNIIVKRPVTLELLDRVTVVFFDKTGTLTLGEPDLISIKKMSGERSENSILSIAAAIEFHSIHPLSRAISAARATRKTPVLEAHGVVETIGKGIAGTVDGVRFSVSKATQSEEEGIVLSLMEEGREIAQFHFEDKMKENVDELFRALSGRGIRMEIITGDRKENAMRLFGHFGIPIHTGVSPEEKFAIIDAEKKNGHTVAMVGDGLNDAPALAHANVGIVFSGTENSAAIEAADAVILGRDIMLVDDLFDTARRSMRVAAESVWGGVALSSLGMVAAAFGYIPPIAGAVIQEVIDVAVILNSLRTAAR